MATYSIFEGGNRRTLPWESIRDSGLDPQYPVMYAAHLKNAHKVIPYHIDFGNEMFREWLKLSVPNQTIAPGDELRTHLFGPGTRVTDVVLQVKGLCPTEGTEGNPAPEPPTIMVELQDAAGNVIGTYGSVDGITLDTQGSAYLTYSPSAGGAAWTGDGNAYLVIRLESGELTCACFGVIVGLIQLFDPHGCECLTPCGADFPAPNCPPSGLISPWTPPAANGGAGGGDAGGGDAGGGGGDLEEGG